MQAYRAILPICQSPFASRAAFSLASVCGIGALCGLLATVARPDGRFRPFWGGINVTTVGAKGHLKRWHGPCYAGAHIEWVI